MSVYLSIFIRTFAALAAVALIAAQGADWAESGELAVNAELLGFALLMALIGAVIAVAWAFVGSAATTPVGRALRSAVQAFLGTPIAGLVLKTSDDLDQLPELIVPALIAAALAFGVSFASNYAPAPISSSDAVVADFVPWKPGT